MGIWTDINVTESYAKNYELSLTSTFNYDWKRKIRPANYRWSVKRPYASSGNHSLEFDYGNPSNMTMYFMFYSKVGSGEIWGKSPMFDMILSDNPELHGEPVFIDMNNTITE